MPRNVFHDIDGIGRTALSRRRGLDALIPTEPAPDVRVMQWHELEAALGHLSHAQFEYERGNPIDGRMWLDDARRSLGTLALTLAEGPAAEGYARLFASILTPPRTPQEATYIERQGDDVRSA